jgi:hypothetical protein
MERDNFKDLDVDARMILKWTFYKWDESTWIGLFWLWIDRWWALVNAVINLRVS